MDDEPEKRGRRYEVISYLLSNLDLLSKPDATVIDAIKAVPIGCADKSIPTWRGDFVRTMQALKDIGRLVARVAKFVPAPDHLTWHHTFNKILFREPLLDEQTIRARLHAENRPAGEKSLSRASMSESLDYFDILYEHCAILRDATTATDIEHAKGERPTVRAALIDDRLGQGQFRDALCERWKNVCAVTGCTVLETLRASHMKPWRDSTNAERLNPANGLLLTAHLDALFDKHLISFTDDGEMLVTPHIQAADQQLLGIPQRLQNILSDEENRFLAKHRAKSQFAI
jgi:hypothetical protein